MASVAAVAGGRGDYTVTVETTPRFVNANCTACGACAEATDMEIPNPFNYGIDKVKAA